MNANWDCVIVGGGAAGLSAALVLGRARRRVLVVDAGDQSNRPAHAVGGLLTHEGVAPAELYERAREQLRGYPSVTVRDGTIEGAALDQPLALRLDDGTRATARRLLLATGMDYLPPDLPGLRELWGGAAFHCPFCHGWEVRDGALAVLGTEMVLHRTFLLRNWSDDVVLLTDGQPLEPGDRTQLEAAGIPIDERRVAALDLRRAEPAAGAPTERDAEAAPALAAIRFADGDRLPRDGVLVGPRMQPRTALADQLGLERNERGAIVVDQVSRTSAPGVFAAGDVAGALQQVSVSIASGATAAAMIVGSLVAEEHGQPFPPEH